MEKLTDKAYWDGTYNCRESQPPLNIDGFRNITSRLILGKLLEIDMENKRILEIGAGDSVWLPYLATRFPFSQFVGVDYSELGCVLLTERTRRVVSNVEVVHEDLFVENSRLHDSFDVAMSFGVVEHFEELGHVLAAKKRYLKHGGVMFTIIPNMAGVSGMLVRMWKREVYDKHNPHDRASFLEGHRKAGLTVISGGYLGSVNFGVLSSCVEKHEGLYWHAYVFLTRLSKTIGWVESKLGGLPASKMFSPYIYAISRVN